MRVAVIGGGAAGFFAAIAVKENHPHAEVCILERSNKVLQKVKVSGGGRCNVTNGTRSISELIKGYPRGARQLKKAFSEFSTTDTFEWFAAHGVELYTQPDGRVFPVTDDSQTIIDCLLHQTRKAGIAIRTGMAVASMRPESDGQLMLTFNGGPMPEKYSKVIVATGGSPMLKAYHWLEEIGHEIEPPVPSLFTFNMPKEDITTLMGVSIHNGIVSVQGSKLRADGPLLITHWGMSGPAILKLSAFGARELHAMDYRFILQVNWTGETDHERVSEALNALFNEHPDRQVSNFRPFSLPERLWAFLLQRCGIPPSRKWKELGKKDRNRMVNLLTNDTYTAEGKTTFKEEFVTCGGVSLSNVDLRTMQSRVVANLYFAGEVLDIDGITGGYNFQAAWTTAYIAAKLR